MKKIVYSLIVSSTLIVLSGNLPVSAESNSSLINRATKEVKQGQIEFALMRYRAILRKGTQSKYADKALFALGEYFFVHSNYEYANNFFKQYIDLQNNNNGKLFALAYLLKIAQSQNDQKLSKNLEKEIKILYPQSFIFRKVKEYKFNSPLSRKHKAVYSIDYIEFEIEDMKLAKITY